MKREELENRLSHIDIEMNDHKIDIKQLKKERKQLKKQLEELPKLEVGKWYKNNDVLYCIEILNGNDAYGYGFDYSEIEIGEYFNDHDTSWTIDDLTPATYKEVQTALIEEAKNRGFKEGVEYECADTRVVTKFTDSYDDSVGEWQFNDNTLSKRFNNYFFKDGKWATIIEQKKVSISGDYTKEDLEKIIETEFK